MRTPVILILAVIALAFCAPAMAADHPAYLHALEDLRAARWDLEHRPGSWAQTDDEMAAVKEIDAAINEIRLASIDDGKDVNDHPKMDEKADHIGRLRDALDYLAKARSDVDMEEDTVFAKGLRNRALQHIDAAIAADKAAIAGGGAPAPAAAMKDGRHPAYLHALSDLRTARWLIEHKTGDWLRLTEEDAAVRKIEAAINDIKAAAIDDGKDIDDHAAVDGRPDHIGRLHDAADFLRKARADVGEDEDGGFARGLQARAWADIDEAIKSVKAAINS